eukprot:2897802-Prymnesium_polylepis.1
MRPNDLQLGPRVRRLHVLVSAARVCWSLGTRHGSLERTSVTCVCAARERQAHSHQLTFTVNHVSMAVTCECDLLTSSSRGRVREATGVCVVRCVQPSVHNES